MRKFRFLILLSIITFLIANSSFVNAGGCSGSCTTGPSNSICSACPVATPYCQGTCDSCSSCSGDPCECGAAYNVCTGSCRACIPNSPIGIGCDATKPICSNGVCYECTTDAHCSGGKTCASNACKCSNGKIWNGASCVMTNPASCDEAGTTSVCKGTTATVDRGYVYIYNPSGIICNSNLNGWSVSGGPESGGVCCNTNGTYYAVLKSTNGATIDATIYSSAYSLTYEQACICGNGACQSSYGESCPSCPGDCPGFNSNNYCSGGKAYGCGYLPTTTPPGNGVNVANCAQAGTTGNYCDTYAQRTGANPPAPYWTTSSLFTTNTNITLCSAGTSTTCGAGNMCASNSGYYCSPAGTWVTTDPSTSGAILCASGVKYTCSAAITCQQAGTTGYYCDTNNTWTTQSRFVRGSIICYDGVKYISNATLKVRVVNNTYNLSNVKVDVVDDANKAVLLKTNMTDQKGIAWLNMSNNSDYPYKLVSIIASRSDFIISITERYRLYYNQAHNITINMVTANDCLADCTRNNDEQHLCDPACNGINGCSYNFQALSACTLPKQAKGARRVLDDNPANQTAIYCCSGSPVVEKKNTNTSIICPGKEMVKMTKIVIIDGEPVKMNVVACSNR